MKLRKEMPSLSKGWKKTHKVVFLFLLASCTQEQQGSDNSVGQIQSYSIPSNQLKVDTFPILSENKINLTKAYSKRFYNTEEFTLTPKMIVVHYTAIPTLEETLTYFKPDSLENSRKNIRNKSVLNVGIHYVVDKDGSIYSLLPDTVLGRHIIGYNQVSIGIENVALDSTELTDAQVVSNVKLIHYLSAKYDSLDYLIGHSEYIDTTLDHYALFKSLDPTYLPYEKPDPGKTFMDKIRNRLKEEYELVFKR